MLSQRPSACMTMAFTTHAWPSQHMPTQVSLTAGLRVVGQMLSDAKQSNCTEVAKIELLQAQRRGWVPMPHDQGKHTLGQMNKETAQPGLTAKRQSEQAHGHVQHSQVAPASHPWWHHE